MILQFLDQFIAWLVILRQYNCCLYDLASYRIGHGCNCALENGRMFEQGAFHLERTDTVTGAFDQVVSTAYEPVIPVFILPGHVTGIVNAIVPYLSGHLRIAVVSFEHADRNGFIGIDNDLAFFTDFTGFSFIVQKTYGIPGGRFAHRTRLGFHPGVIRNRHCKLGLAISLIKFESGRLKELVINLRIERFACYNAVFQAAQVIFRQVFLYEEPVNRRRRAERSYFVPGNHVEKLTRNELVIVINKHGCAAEPLSVYLAPHGLSPACIGYGKMQTSVGHVLPVLCRKNMAKRISEIVLYHLRHASRAGSEIEQHCVVIACCFTADRPVELVGHSFHFGIEI